MVRLYPEIALPGTSEEIVKVLVPAAEWIASMLPAIGDALSTCRWIDRGGVGRYETFVLLTYEHVRTMEGSFQQLTFGKNYAAIDPATGKPYSATPVRRKTYTDDWSWDMIINDLEVVVNKAFPQSTQNPSGGTSFANRLSLRLDGVPAIEKGTTFIRREYLGTVPFRIPRARVPIPGMINIDYLGLTERIPASLHGDITLDDQQALIATLGGTAQANQTVPGAKYPATNFTTWRPYIYPDHQDTLDSGLWYRFNILLLPPQLSPAIRLN